MTKQAFEDAIDEIVSHHVHVETYINQDGMIRVSKLTDIEPFQAAVTKLYNEVTTTQTPTPSQPEQPTPTSGLFLELVLGHADVTLPDHPLIIAGVTTDGPSKSRLLVDVEAWQDGKKIDQVFTQGITVSKGFTTEVDLRLPKLASGTYNVKAFIFEAPKNEGDSWGKKLWGNEDAGTLTVTAAPAYESTAPNKAGYARLPQQVDQYVGQHPELKAIADQPTGVWLGMEWVPDAEKRGQEMIAAAGDLPPLIVVYSIPNRDTGEYSQGGAKSPEAYRAWIDGLAKGIGNHPTIYIMEPDALGHLDRMSEDQIDVRLNLLVYAANKLRTREAKVYIDASMWVQPLEMFKRIDALRSFATGKWVLDGFSINTSNYKKLSVCQEYGDALSKLTGLPYLIDTSRNGIGTDLSDGRWCNVPGQAIGERPDLNKGYVWAKAVGESDGPENGGPNAGEFWVEGALALVRNGRPTA